jgi:hypothetical protein
MGAVFRILPVQVDAPACGEGRILVEYMLHDVVFFQDIVARQAAGLTLSGNIIFRKCSFLKKLGNNFEQSTENQQTACCITYYLRIIFNKKSGVL